jgi:hypothetical protein
MLERYSEEGQFREGSVHAMRTSWKKKGNWQEERKSD